MPYSLFGVNLGFLIVYIIVVFVLFKVDFFSRYPPSGQLYAAFTNAKRKIPPEPKLRRSARHKKLMDVDTKPPVEEAPIETGTAIEVFAADEQLKMEGT